MKKAGWRKRRKSCFVSGLEKKENIRFSDVISVRSGQEGNGFETIIMEWVQKEKREGYLTAGILKKKWLGETAYAGEKTSGL